MAKKPETVADDRTPKPPKQVQEQIAQAEAIRAEIEGKPPESPPAAEQESAAPPSAPSQPAEPEAQPAPPAPPAEDGESWEQRFRSQQGRFEQVTRNNQALMDRINELERQVTTLRIKGAEEDVRQLEPRQRQRLLTEQEAQEYGDEF